MNDWSGLGDWIWASLLGLAAIAPLGTFLAVVVAYISYLQKVRADRRALGQKTEADNRNAWWSRVQWAIDAALSDDEQRRATGMAAIEQMQDSELATDADQELLAAMANAVLDETVEALEAEDEQDEGLAGISSVEDNESNEGGDTGDGYETRR
jgi:hypothetical protein